MRLVLSKKPDPNEQLAIPAFLDRREFVDNGGETYFVSRITDEMLGIGVTRVWAPIKTASEIRRKELEIENNPMKNIWIENKLWPVQVVTTGKNPQNLQLHANYEDFMKFHDFEDYPPKQAFSGGDTTYIVVKSDGIKNSVSDAIKDIDTPKHDVVEQNGVKRPKSNSLTGKAWAMYDQTLVPGNEMTIEKAQAFLRDAGMNGSTVRTQYAHWRKFNNISK